MLTSPDQTLPHETDTEQGDGTRLGNANEGNPALHLIGEVDPVAGNRPAIIGYVADRRDARETGQIEQRRGFAFLTACLSIVAIEALTKKVGRRLPKC